MIDNKRKKMPYIPPGKVALAKQIDLLTYMKNYEPDNLKAEGYTSYRVKSVSGLKISNGKWCWWNGGMVGGTTAVNYFVKVHGYSFQEAVLKVLGNALEKPPVFVPAQKNATVFVPPPSSDTNADAIHYLKKRRIDESLIQYCIAKKVVYQSKQEINRERCHREYRTVVFAGYDYDGDMKYANIRQIAGTLKGEAPGSQKQYAFGLESIDPVCSTAHFFEAPIDALSYETIQMYQQKPFLNEYLQSTGGIFCAGKEVEATPVPLAVRHFFETHPLVKHAYIHFDNDEKGRAATKLMQVILPLHFDVKVYDEPPPKGKDYNDYLSHHCISGNRKRESSYAR